MKKYEKKYDTDLRSMAKAKSFIPAKNTTGYNKARGISDKATQAEG